MKLQLLIDLVRTHPAVRSCIQRVYNEIVPTQVQVKESGTELTPDLQRFIGPWIAQFLTHALEMAYMCGVVVFGRKYLQCFRQIHLVISTRDHHHRSSGDRVKQKTWKNASRKTFIFVF
jgi:hypothetical protein